MKFQHLIFWTLLLLGAIALAACAGPAGAPGPAGPAGPAGPPGPPGEAAEAPAEVAAVAAIQPETCVMCHPDAGEKHQASYDELYQDGVIKVTDMTYKFTTNPDTTVITFKMTKNGAPINGGAVQSLGIYFTPYTGTSFEGAGRLSLKGKLTYDPASGVTTSTLEEKDPTAEGYVDYTNIGGVDGLIALYGRDAQVGTLPVRVSQSKYPFAAVLETGKGVDYASLANSAGCEKCHTEPFLKHGYIYGTLNNDPATDFYVCKGCHLDNGKGGHYEWQLLVEDPALAASFLAGETELTAEQEAKYAYTTRLMNDVHMSHAMEFPYPQSMANCATCHEGKLDKVLVDANFEVETCKSCHPMTAPEEGTSAKRAPALANIMPHEMTDAECSTCHMDGGVAPVFSAIHTGYDKNIYADAAGTRYSDIFTVSVDEASLADNLLTIKFSAAKNADVTTYKASDIIPTVMVGLYGYDTKDFIVDAHGRDADDNRLLEFPIDGKTINPRFTVVHAAGTGGGSGGGTGGGGGTGSLAKWEVTVDLSMWADMIADGTVKRAEIGIMPLLADIVGEIDSRANGETDDTAYALNAPTRTFDLKANAFDDKFYSPIVKTVDGCNDCHDALATTFHKPDRSGNVTLCRMCHTIENGASHLEMQSRSIDSYVHAIHSFQAFDIGAIDFADPVQSMHYDHHIEFVHPKLGITDCESCHVEGAFNVPDQAKSLPGLLSGSSEVQGWDRKIGVVPSYVTGPAARACGGCHRAELINEDSAGGLAIFNLHTKQGGIQVEAGEDPASTLQTVIDQVMALFK